MAGDSFFIRPVVTELGKSFGSVTNDHFRTFRVFAASFTGPIRMASNLNCAMINGNSAKKVLAIQLHLEYY